MTEYNFEHQSWDTLAYWQEHEPDLTPVYIIPETLIVAREDGEVVGMVAISAEGGEITDKPVVAPCFAKNARTMMGLMDRMEAMLLKSGYASYRFFIYEESPFYPVVKSRPEVAQACMELNGGVWFERHLN